MKILGIPGSLREGSYNKALLNAAITLAPEDVDIEIYDLKDIPLYNQDISDRNYPSSVKDFKEVISKYEGVIIATPEYNYSVPGVLKNAIDWASRPPALSPLHGKPLAIMGASTGVGGTIRAQLNLRNIALALNMFDMKKPEVLVMRVQEKFDEGLNLTDETLKDHLKKFLLAFRDWVNIFKNENELRLKATNQN